MNEEALQRTYDIHKCTRREHMPIGVPLDVLVQMEWKHRKNMFGGLLDVVVRESASKELIQKIIAFTRGLMTR